MRHLFAKYVIILLANSRRGRLTRQNNILILGT